MSGGSRRPEAILLMGLPGAGKSTFYQLRYGSTHLRINLDMLRTRRREALLLHACLEAGQPFVVDNTNVTPEDRARYIGPAHEAGFSVTGCWFEPDLAGCLRRNRRREGAGRVPEAAVRNVLARLRPPSAGEGFDRLVRVAARDDGTFEVSDAEPPA